MTLHFSTTPLMAMLALISALTLAPARAQGVIKIGEINSYKAQPAFLEPYKKGMELAVEKSTPLAASTAKPCSSSCVTTTPTRATRCGRQRSCSRAKKSMC